MAQKVIIELVDDLNPETPAEATYTFAVGPVQYTIDLNAKNGAAFEKALEKYIGAARRIGRTPGSKGSKKARRSPQPVNLNDVRAWAREQNMYVSDYGRVPNAIMDQYRMSH